MYIPQASLTIAIFPLKVLLKYSPRSIGLIDCELVALHFYLVVSRIMPAVKRRGSSKKLLNRPIGLALNSFIRDCDPIWLLDREVAVDEFRPVMVEDFPLLVAISLFPRTEISIQRQWHGPCNG